MGLRTGESGGEKYDGEKGEKGEVDKMGVREDERLDEG